MVCRVRYLSSAGIHSREIPGIDVLANAYPANWLLYTSLQCYPRNEPPIEMDAMIVMDDRVLLLEIKDWNGTLTHNGDQWLVNGRGRGRSAVDSVSMKAKKVKSFLKNSIPGFSKVYVDSRVVLTGSATKHGLSAAEQNHVWTLQEAASIVNPAQKAALLQQTTFQLKKVYTFETELERVTRNAKMFGPMEALWDGYRVVEEDVVVHPRRVWREHRAERVRDLRYKALLRVWAFDQLPPGLNSPDKRRFIADREMRAIGRLTDAGSRLAQNGGILLPIGDDKEEILTQHFELRTLPPNWTTLDRYVAKAQDEWAIEDRIVATTTLLNLVSELHTQGIAHRDIGRRSIWTGGATRFALTGLMSCQMPDEESIGDWATTLRGYADPAPEDADPSLIGTGAQRDVFALGRLASEILTGNIAGPAAELGEDMPATLPDLSSWFRRSTAKVPSGRFANAREMVDEFTWLIEQNGNQDVDQTLIDRHETTDNPYVVYPILRNLHQGGRSHVYISANSDGEEFVVKLWMGLRRNASSAIDLALMRLLDGISRLVSSPVRGLPSYARAALSALGPFVVYRHEAGRALDFSSTGPLGDLDADRALNLAAGLVQAVDALHGMGCSHGDIAGKNIVVREIDGELVLVDLFDLTDVGDGMVRTPSHCPDGWEALTRQQVDRYATLKVLADLFAATSGDSLSDVIEGIQEELARPAIETLEPVMILLRVAAARLRGPVAPKLTLRFPGGTADFFRSDDGLYYLRASRPRPGIVQYAIAGIEREFTFGVRNGAVEDVQVGSASFTSLSHASQHGLPVRIDISISDGPDAGFEELFAHIAPLIAATLPDEEADAAAPAPPVRLDVERYWRKLLELEQSFQPEVEILKDVSPPRGPLAAYAYERVGLDFDFDAGSTVEVRLPGGRKVGEVNLEHTDAQTLVVEQSDKRLNVGDHVNLVDRRARTSFDRRTKAIERILDDEAAIPGLVDYFIPDRTMTSSEYDTTVAEDVLDKYRLNPGQKAAFRHVAQHGPVGLLQGPPGTGKTHFIAAFAHWLVNETGAGKILIASQSHEAVNNVIEALLDLFKRVGGRRPSLLRIGSKGITEKIRPYHTSALQERFQSRFDAAFKHRVSGLGTAVGLRRKFVDDAVEIDRQFGTRVRRLEMLAAAERNDSVVPANERRQRDTAVRNAVEMFKKAGAHVLNRDVDPLAPDEELAAAYALLLERYPGTSPADIRKVRHLIELSREWSESLASPHRNFEEFLAKTRSIVTATCVGVGQTKIRIDKKTYDWVIVDEAARCTPGELAVPIQVGRRVLLVGDHRQLLPMIERRVAKGLRDEMPDIAPAEFTRSDFERAYLSSYGAQNGRTLTEQYRMTRPICELVSKIFYEPDNVQLITSEKREGDIFFQGELGAPLSHPIAWIDTSAQPRHVEQPAEWNKTTFWNAAEVEAVLRLLERLSENAALVASLAGGASDAPIGVICMYSAQKVKIEQAFSSRPWEARFRRLVRIETVDSYQGKENTIVIVSLVRCNNGQDQGHVRLPNRCNVALSRAKERLFIVGARSMWGNVAEKFPMRRVLTELDAQPMRAITIAAGEL